MAAHHGHSGATSAHRHASIDAALAEQETAVQYLDHCCAKGSIPDAAALLQPLYAIAEAGARCSATASERAGASGAAGQVAQDESARWLYHSILRVVGILAHRQYLTACATCAVCVQAPGAAPAPGASSAAAPSAGSGQLAPLDAAAAALCTLVGCVPDAYYDRDLCLALCDASISLAAVQGVVAAFGILSTAHGKWHTKQRQAANSSEASVLEAIAQDTVVCTSMLLRATAQLMGSMGGPAEAVDDEIALQVLQRLWGIINGCDPVQLERAARDVSDDGVPTGILVLQRLLESGARLLDGVSPAVVRQPGSISYAQHVNTVRAEGCGPDSSPVERALLAGHVAALAPSRRLYSIVRLINVLLPTVVQFVLQHEDDVRKLLLIAVTVAELAYAPLYAPLCGAPAAASVLLKHLTNLRAAVDLVGVMVSTLMFADPSLSVAVRDLLSALPLQVGVACVSLVAVRVRHSTDPAQAASLLPWLLGLVGATWPTLACRSALFEGVTMPAGDDAVSLDAASMLTGHLARLASSVVRVALVHDDPALYASVQNCLALAAVHKSAAVRAAAVRVVAAVNQHTHRLFAPRVAQCLLELSSHANSSACALRAVRSLTALLPALPQTAAVEVTRTLLARVPTARQQPSLQAAPYTHLTTDASIHAARCAVTATSVCMMTGFPSSTAAVTASLSLKCLEAATSSCAEVLKQLQRVVVAMSDQPADRFAQLFVEVVQLCGCCARAAKAVSLGNATAPGPSASSAAVSAALQKVTGAVQESRVSARALLGDHARIKTVLSNRGLLNRCEAAMLVLDGY